MRDPHIGVWGTPRAGKSTFIARLYTELLHSKWSMTAFENDEKTKQFIKNILEPINQGVFPPATPLGGTYSFLFEHQRKGFRHRNKRYRLEMIDAAGGILTEDFLKDYQDNYYEYLQTCDGLLMMIDPEIIYKDDKNKRVSFYYRLIARLIEEISQNEGDQPFILPNVAVCITKIDLEQHWMAANRPYEFLEEIIGEKSYNLLFSAAYSDRIKVFTTSSVGRYITRTGLERPNLIKTLDGDRIARPYEKAYNVSRSLLWLFHRIDLEKLTFLERFGREPLYYEND